VSPARQVKPGNVEPREGRPSRAKGARQRAASKRVNQFVIYAARKVGKSRLLVGGIIIKARQLHADLCPRFGAWKRRIAMAARTTAAGSGRPHLWSGNPA